MIWLISSHDAPRIRPLVYIARHRSRVPGRQRRVHFGRGRGGEGRFTVPSKTRGKTRARWPLPHTSGTRKKIETETRWRFPSRLAILARTTYSTVMFGVIHLHHHHKSIKTRITSNPRGCSPRSGRFPKIYRYSRSCKPCSL